MTRKGEPAERGRGRPRGSGPGRMEGRFAVKATPEYKAWLAALAGHLNATEADVFREAMRRLADAAGFRPPPLR